MPTNGPLLSVVIPVFNEISTLEKTLCRLNDALKDFSFEIIIVDDGSTDGTAQLVRELSDARTLTFLHAKNRGKGAALRTAFQHTLGEVVVIQDADLEYDPQDIPQLVRPICDGCADVVFGSRFADSSHSDSSGTHRMGNQGLTWISNRIHRLRITDMETGYKAFRKDILDKICIREDGFGVEPELVAKIARLGCSIREVPISYQRRGYHEGKKIRLRDGLWALWCIVRYRFFD